MNIASLDNLPPLTKQEALNILATPLNDLKLGSDYYKAVFHLAKYPCKETEEALLALLYKESFEQPIQIAQRKAIEILAHLDCRRAIPVIGNLLTSDDPYIVENSAWALNKLGCNEKVLHSYIGTLLTQPNQNRRILVQSLSGMLARSELSKIRDLFNSDPLSPGVKGACIAAIFRLTGESSEVSQLGKYLELPNQNDRQSAVQDIIDANASSLLGKVVSTPISPFFKLRAIDHLWSKKLDNNDNKELFNIIETTLIDDPNKLALVKSSNHQEDIDSCIKKLFNTDFNVGYIALKILLGKKLSNVFPHLINSWDKITKDYGAIYFLTILFRKIEGLDQSQTNLVIEFLFSCLSNDWPLFMKFRSSAIISLMKIDPSICKGHISQWLDVNLNPYWPCRYSTLMCMDELLGPLELYPFIGDLKNKFNDNNRFVSAKAKDIFYRL
ncbi:HEAT repeat domain-containing protein [Prochlorococcus marinus]|uniref:Bilin biosynthesis protein CpeY n=1 Tax=Prochlorococcus marinus (strain MIT 9211) TaxID=93059 RepID=A9BDV7_PROM4|nr:HEAT repeat domain-containing protein [Prochlorococcus marinus]ABX08267.1 Hypothetical protein P9211_03361 [Prochlorococcus marinus str. MIT 9211]